MAGALGCWDKCLAPRATAPTAAWVPAGARNGARRPRPAAPPPAPTTDQVLLWRLGLAAPWAWTVGTADPRPQPLPPGLPYHLLQELVATHTHTLCPPQGCTGTRPGPLGSPAVCLSSSTMVIPVHSRGCRRQSTYVLPKGTGLCLTHLARGTKLPHDPARAHKRLQDWPASSCKSGPVSRQHHESALCTSPVPDHRRRGRPECQQEMWEPPHQLEAAHLVPVPSPGTHLAQERPPALGATQTGRRQGGCSWDPGTQHWASLGRCRWPHAGGWGSFVLPAQGGRPTGPAPVGRKAPLGGLRICSEKKKISGLKTTF